MPLSERDMSVVGQWLETHDRDRDGEDLRQSACQRAQEELDSGTQRWRRTLALESTSLSIKVERSDQAVGVEVGPLCRKAVEPVEKQVRTVLSDNILEQRRGRTHGEAVDHVG